MSNIKNRYLFNSYKQLLNNYTFNNKKKFKDIIEDPIISILSLSIFKNTQKESDNSYGINNIQDFVINVELLLKEIKKVEFGKLPVYKFKKILSLHKQLINNYTFIIGQLNDIQKLHKFLIGYKTINNCFKKIENISIKNSSDIKNITEDIYCNVIQTSLVISWILGDGDLTQINKIKNIGNHIGYLYKIYIDVISDNKDDKNNYLQHHSHFEVMEIYLEHKEKLLIEMIHLNIKFDIIDEIIKYFDEKIALISNGE